MTELRRRMLEELRLRNYSPNTIDTYIRCVAKFAQHFGLPPDGLGPEHIREYQLFLVQEKKAAWALFNQTVCALRFFYHHVLHRDWMIEHIPYPRHEQKLSVVLSPAEVAARVSWRAEVPEREEELYQMAQPGWRDRMGRLCQTALRRTSTSAEIPGALYPPRRHLQPTSDFAGKRPRDLPLEELRSWQPARHHDPAGGRVHPPLSAARSTAASSKSGTSDCWPTAAGGRTSPYAAKCWRLARRRGTFIRRTTGLQIKWRPTSTVAVRAVEPGTCSASKLFCRNSFRPPCSTAPSAATSAKWTRRSKDAPTRNTFSFRSRRRSMPRSVSSAPSGSSASLPRRDPPQEPREIASPLLLFTLPTLHALASPRPGHNRQA